MGIPKKVMEVLEKHHISLIEFCEILNELGIISYETVEELKMHPATTHMGVESIDN